MSHLPIDKSKDPTPIRLFKSNFLEFFTHISPIAVLIIWVPIVILFTVLATKQIPKSSNLWIIISGFLAGMVFWTFLEYTLHRFLFHFPGQGKRIERIIFLFHGIHHAQPQCKTRLVMPPAVSIPMAVIFFGLYYFVLVKLLSIPAWLFPVFAGTILGYLIYDMIHYATHHFAMHSGYAKFLKRYHMQHHFKTPNQRYGVSSPLWDYVFRTHPQS